jgi:beta,beta-carotene 9',10'-dioxygenase
MPPPEASGLITTAHPHAAPGTRDLVNYMLKFGRHSRYLVYRQGPADAAPTMVGEIPADLPGYVHSFAITEHHVILAIFPLVVNPLSFLLHNRPFIDNYRWQPDLGLRIVVLDLTSGAVRADCRAPAAFAFHHINAYEDGNAIVMDLCAYPDAGIVDVFRLERLRDGEVLPPCRPSRYHIDPDAGTVDVATLVDQTLDLPRINYGRHNGPLPLRLRVRRRPIRSRRPVPVTRRTYSRAAAWCRVGAGRGRAGRSTGASRRSTATGCTSR